MSEPTPVPLPDGRPFHVYSEAETRSIYREVFIDREYLQHGIVIRPGDCVFDVGASIGLFSLFGHRQAPDLRLHAFEPAPPLFAILGRNSQTYFPDATLHNCLLRRAVARAFMKMARIPRRPRIAWRRTHAAARRFDSTLPPASVS